MDNKNSVALCLVNLTFSLLIWSDVLFIIFTLGTRKAFDGCIVRQAERSDEIAITDNSFTRKFNWDLIFPVLGVISAVKLYS